jgi:phosphate/phosphite/phosphonate ABC transporter binding protein
MKPLLFRGIAALALGLAFSLAAQAAKEVVIGIGTQNTTTNTVTGGVVLKELKLLEKHLPKTGKYKDISFKLDWQNFTSGPPITNGMMAKKLHIGMMGDYPLLVNGATGQSQSGNETALVAIIAYNAYGSGNGLVVHKDSPYYELADLKGKNVSFGSQSSTSGHLMPRSFLLQANIDPDKDFKRVAYSGAHDATIASVVGGRVDAAALDITVWRKFVEEKKVDTTKVNVFFTTPPYFNYNWSVHADMPAALRERITKALLDLSMATPEGKEILTLNRATKYIATKPENYKNLESAGRSAGLIK